MTIPGGDDEQPRFAGPSTCSRSVIQELKAIGRDPQFEGDLCRVVTDGQLAVVGVEPVDFRL